MEAVLEADQVGRLLVDEVLAELVAADHLEHDAAEVADPLLAQAKQCPPLTAQLARGRERPAGRRRR